MPLEKYEDFLDMQIKDLQDYLAVRGLNIPGRKTELVARPLAVFELKIEIKSTSEDQRKRLETEYLQNMKELSLPDPNTIEENKRLDNITKWPTITMGNIFSYVLQHKDFNTDYVGKYKDQKAYSDFDSGFVGPVLVYEPKLAEKKKIIYVYCKVTASQAIHEQKSLWIIIKKIDEKGSNIISAWCSFMAGANRTCNHVIATLYKLEYANSKGWCNPACTETTCQWNQEHTRKSNQNI